MAASLKERLTTVFNRGFWDGYYQGARLGEWSDVYGNKATRTKIYIGKVTNYFSNIGVAEVMVATGSFSVGDSLLITGPTTGVIEYEVPEIRVDMRNVGSAVKAIYALFPLPKNFAAATRSICFSRFI